MEARSDDALARLLAHADMRVRQEAQFELAARGGEAWQTLARIAGSKESTLAADPCRSGAWARPPGRCATAIARASGARSSPCSLIADPEVRAQAAKVLGEAKEPRAFDSADRPARRRQPAGPLLRGDRAGQARPLRGGRAASGMLRVNDDRDPYLRHAGVMGLAGSGKPRGGRRRSATSRPRRRMGVLLGLATGRRSRDRPVPGRSRSPARARSRPGDQRRADRRGVARLAALPVSRARRLPLVRRVLNANFRLGRPEHAAFWPRPPSGRTCRTQRGAGAWRCWPTGPSRRAATRLSGSGGRFRLGRRRPAAAALRAQARHALRHVARERPQPRRCSPPRRSRSRRPARLSSALAGGSTDRPDRARAVGAQGPRPTERSPVESTPLDERCSCPGPGAAPRRFGCSPRSIPPRRSRRFKTGSRMARRLERQGAIAILAAMPGEAARRPCSSWLDRLIAGQVPAEIQLDLIEAAAKRTEPEFRRKIEQYESSKTQDDPLAAYREVLSGGDAERGMTIFTTKAELECVRCHKVKGPAGEPTGGDVGPELSGVGARQSRTVSARIDRQPQQADRSGVRVGRARDERRQGPHRRSARRRCKRGAARSPPRQVDCRAQGLDRGAQARTLGHAHDLAEKLSKSELRDLIEYLGQPRKPGEANCRMLTSFPRAYRPAWPPASWPRAACLLLVDGLVLHVLGMLSLNLSIAAELVPLYGTGPASGVESPQPARVTGQDHSGDSQANRASMFSPRVDRHKRLRWRLSSRVPQTSEGMAILTERFTAVRFSDVRGRCRTAPGRTV